MLNWNGSLRKRALLGTAIPINGSYSKTNTAGRLTTVQDIAAGQITHFDYTNEDRRQMVGVTLNDGTVLRFAHSTLDAVGREIAIFDTLVSGTISYDLNGNRRRHQVTLFNPQTGTNQLCDHWFTYDHADRVLIANGALASGVISITAQQGLTRTYQNNQLMTETSANNQKSFAYNPNGSIKQLADDNSITNITYSPEGYTLQTVVISSTKTQTNTYAVDAQGHTTGSKQVTNTSTDNTSSSTFDVNGESVTRTTHDNTGDIPIEYDLTTQYAGFDSPQITAVAGHTNEKYGNAYTNCAVYHNPNGNISAKVGAHYGDGNGDPQAVIFTTTFDGIILRKLTLPSGNWLEIDPKDISTQGNFYTVDGNYICSAQMPYQENTVLTNVYANYMQQEISEHGPTNKDFNAEQTQLMGQLKQQQDIFNNPLTYLIGRYYGFSNEDIYRIHQHSIATFRDLFAKNFDGHSTRLLQVQEFVNAFDSSSLSSPPNQYIVQTNETFPAIAQIVYGDSSYAATLAEANGYAPSQTPDPGSQLMVPKMTSAHNTAHNYTPYDQITQSLIGPLYPNLKFAQPHHSCWQVILEVAISVFAVAISVCTLGAGTGVALALETAALAGLVDASAQELFCGIGLLDKFSWEDVVGAAASGGFGLGASSAAQSLSAGEKILHIAEAGMRLALEYGAVNIGVQLTQMSVGTRNHFDFKELLAVMATSAMASAFGKLKGLTESVVAGQLEEITENYISSMIYSAIADTKYSWTNATAALIGEETGGLVANRINQQKIKNAQTAANDKYVTAMLHGAGIDLDPISNNPSHVPYAPLPNVHQPTPNTPQHSQPLALRTDYYNNHRNADYFTDNTPSPASVPARPTKPQAHAATPQKIAPKAQPAHADAKHSAKVSMRSIMDDATKLAQKSEACVKQAWGDVEKTATHAWNHPKQDALKFAGDVKQLDIGEAKEAWNVGIHTLDFITGGSTPDAWLPLSKPSNHAQAIGADIVDIATLALPVAAIGGAAAEAEAAGSVFEAAAVETSGETASQVGLFGRGAGGFTRSLGSEAVESSQVATRSEQLAVEGGVFGGGGEEPLLFKTGGLSAEEANAPFVEAGKRPPYISTSRERIIQLQRERTFVRVHTKENPISFWMMRPKEIEGLTAEEIQDNFALPYLPTQVSEVHLPPRSYLQLGGTAGQIGWGTGGAIQYQALDWLDKEVFKNTMSIEEYQNQFERGYQP